LFEVQKGEPESENLWKLPTCIVHKGRGKGKVERSWERKGNPRKKTFQKGKRELRARKGMAAVFQGKDKKGKLSDCGKNQSQGLLARKRGEWESGGCMSEVAEAERKRGEVLLDQSRMGGE